MKKHKKLARYIRGSAKALTKLANEIEQSNHLDTESEELLKKIAGEMLYEAVAYKYLTSN